MSKYSHLLISRDKQVMNPDHKYQDAKTCTSIIGCDTDSLYLYCSGQEMPCSKEEYVEMSSKQSCKELCDQIMQRELFGFLQVDIHVPSVHCLLWIPFPKN